MKIRITSLHPTAEASLGCLATSWYAKGLTSRDIADLIVASVKEVLPHLEQLHHAGYIELTTHNAWKITERGLRRIGRVR